MTETKRDPTLTTSTSVRATRWLLDSAAAVSPRLAGRLALELWRRPLGRAEVRPGERAVHQEARLVGVHVGGRPVATYRWGDGARPVLLVHGWRSRASRWSSVVAGLVDAGYTPVAYDAPGHGASGGRAVTILEHERIVQALAERDGPFEAVVAHSFGVPVALYAVRQGLAAHRAVAISGVGDFGYLVDAFCGGLGVRPVVATELRRAVERAFFDGDPGTWRRFSADVAADCDVLVVHDADDVVVDPAQADVITAAYGERATYVATQGLGHGRILDDPTVVATVLDFLGRGRR